VKCTELSCCSHVVRGVNNNRAEIAKSNRALWGLTYKTMCYNMSITVVRSSTAVPAADSDCSHQINILTGTEGDFMVIKIDIDFNSEEAIYIQLRNQIIVGIATSQIQEGDALPSVRQLAENIGINMHTVNKAYLVLKHEGFLKLDRRKGAIISLENGKEEALLEMRKDMSVLLAKGRCKNISCQEVHRMVDEIFSEFGQDPR